MFRFFKKKTKEEKNPFPTGITPGRISVTENSGIFQIENSIQPDFPIEYLDIIEILCAVNPDFSQAVENCVTIGNTGHHVEVFAKEEREIEEVLTRLNHLARKLYRFSPGADGLINALLSQIVKTGAVSAECVIKPDLTGIQEIVRVPAGTIRFYLKNGEQRAFQKISSRFDPIELNPATYCYYGLGQSKDSPYALPPFLSGLKLERIQRDVIDNIRFIARKLGLLGFVTLQSDIPPAKQGETEEEYRSRLTHRLQSMAEGFSQNYRDGVGVSYKDQEIKHHNIASNASGTKYIAEYIETLLLSGLKGDPSMFGRTYSTTETYAGVIYDKMKKQIANSQRLTKRFLEFAYMLDCCLGGFNASVSVQFNKISELDEKKSQETFKIKIENIVKLRDEGFIDQEEAARRLGIFPPASYGPTREKPTGVFQQRFEYDSRFQKYIYNPIRLALTTKKTPAVREYGSFHPLPENPRMICLSGDSSLQFEHFVRDYMRDVLEIDEKTREHVLEGIAEKLKKGEFEQGENFAEELYGEYSRKYPKELKKHKISEATGRNIQTSYQFFRVEDTSIGVLKGGSLSLPDQRAIKFCSGLDDFYFGKSVTNSGIRKEMLNWLKENDLEKGLYDVDGFISKFGEKLGLSTYNEYARIVETSASRVRNWAHVRKLSSSGILQFEVIEILDRLTCPSCMDVNGRIYSVRDAEACISNALEKTPEIYASSLKVPSLQNIRESGSDLAKEFGTIVPIHPRCRGRIVARRTENAKEHEDRTGTKIPQDERFGPANYWERGKKYTFTSREKDSKSRQTTLFSIVDKTGNNIYFTKESRDHVLNDKGRKDVWERSKNVINEFDQLWAVNPPMGIHSQKYTPKYHYYKQINGKHYIAVVHTGEKKTLWTAYSPEGIKKYKNKEKYTRVK